MPRFLKQYWPLLLIVTLSASLRFFALFHYGDFWFDEMFSFTYSQKPWLDSFRMWVWETNPPFHMFVLKLFFYITTPSELTARLPSLIASVATIAFIYLIGTKLFTRRVGILASLLLTLSPQHILFSITARTYAILILLSLLSGYYFIKIFVLENEADKKDKTLFVLLHIMLLYSHLTSASIIMSEFIILIASNKKKIKLWMTLLFMSVLPWLIWAIPALSFKLNFHTYKQAWFFNSAIDFDNYAKTLQMSLLGFFRQSFYILPLILFYLLLFISTVYKTIKRQSNQSLLLAITSLAIFPFLLAVSFSTLDPKFYIICLPWALLVIAYILSDNLPTWTYPIFLLIFLPGLQLFFTILPVSNWSAINKYLVTNIPQHHKTVLVYNSFVNKNEVDYYLHLSIPTINYTPHKIDNWDHFLITENYFRIRETKEKIDAWAQSNGIYNFDDIFLMQTPDNTYESVDILTVLKEKGYRLTTTSAVMPIINTPTIFHLVK
jgi:hypothetical protein